MPTPLHCRCGSVQGHVDTERSTGHAICYCKDCQAYARFLGREQQILDSYGGTEIVACVPRSVHFTAGVEKIACMSLSEKGLLRWYASCCRTALGNTPRNHKVAYVGLVRDCLPGDDAALERAFGPIEVVLNTGSAHGKITHGARPLKMIFSMLKITRNLIGERINGGYKDNPFFDAHSGTPLKRPQALSLAERKALY